MAIGFERRQASLIGAGDLPTARVSGATPDLTGFRRLGNTMIQAGAEKAAEDRRKQALADRIKGMEAGANGGQAYVGKDQTGAYVEFVPPDGSVEYQQGYLEAFNDTQSGKFRLSLEGRYNEIQGKVTAGELTSDEAGAMMQSYLQGALETAPKHLRGSFYQTGQAEIAQRSGLMTSQRASQNAQLVVDDIVALNKQDLEAASSKAAAGGDPGDIYTRMDARFDQLVKLRRMGEAEATAAKGQVRDIGTAQALVNRMTTALARGEVDVEQLDAWQTALDSNNPDAVVVQRKGYQVGPMAKSSVDIGYKTGDVFAKIRNEDVRKDAALKIRTAVNDVRQYQAAHANEKLVADQLYRLSSDAGRYEAAPSYIHDDLDKLAAGFLAASNPFADMKAQGQFLEHLGQTKYFPKPLAATLSNMINSGDPQQAEQALQFYVRATTYTNKWGDSVGEALRNSMPAETRTLLDSVDEGYRMGYSVEQLTQNLKTARGNREFETGVLINAYDKDYAGKDGAYGLKLRTDWATKYGRMPDPEVKAAFDYAYRQNMIVLRDPEKSFAKAFEVVTSKFRPSAMTTTGIERGSSDLTNPSGYVPNGLSGLFGSQRGTEYEWLNGTIAADIANAPGLIRPAGPNGQPLPDEEWKALTGGDFKGGALAAPDAPDKGFFAKALDVMTTPWGGGTDTIFVGKSVKLEPVPGGNPDQPEYQLHMFDKQGNDLGILMQEAPNGSSKPFIVNPHLDKAQIEAKNAARTDLDAAEKGASSLLQNLDVNTISQLPLTDRWSALTSEIPLSDYLLKAAPDMAGKYKLDRQQIIDGLEGARKRYEERTGEKLPPSKIDRQSLLMPRAAGFPVAAAAAAVVDKVLPDGTGGTFLLRLAAQESNFGTAAGTFRLSGDKGMTQVNTGSGFKEVKRRIAMGEGRVWAASKRLEQELGLDLSNIQPADLDKPVVAMAVARLYVEAVGKPVPADVEGQARWWKRHYNTVLGTGTADQFVRSASKVPEDWRNRLSEES